MWLEFTFLMGPSAPRWTNVTIACLARTWRLSRFAAFAADVVFNLNGPLQTTKGGGYFAGRIASRKRWHMNQVDL